MCTREDRTGSWRGNGRTVDWYRVYRVVPSGAWRVAWFDSSDRYLIERTFLGYTLREALSIARREALGMGA